MTQANKIVIKSTNFLKYCVYYDAIHDFSGWLRTGSNPADNNQFRSHTGKNVLTICNNDLSRL